MRERVKALVRVSEIVDVVSKDSGFSKEEIMSKGGTDELKRIRRMIWFIAYYDMCYSAHRIALIFKREASTVAPAIKFIERELRVSSQTMLDIVAMRSKLSDYEKTRRNGLSLTFA